MSNSYISSPVFPHNAAVVMVTSCEASKTYKSDSSLELADSLRVINK